MEYTSSLLLLVIAASVFSVRSQCPSWDFYPCTCKVEFITEDMTVACKQQKTQFGDLKSALRQFSKVEEISSLELSNLERIGTIPSNLFEGNAVRQITISNSVIDFECSKPTLKGLEDSLQVLTIKSSMKYKNVPAYLKLGHLKALKTLTLSNNELTELHEDMLNDEMPNLNYLLLLSNGIRNIREGAFENLTNLKYFILSGNYLPGNTSLQRNMIPTPATQLMKLSLDDNGLTDLPANLFNAMPSLEAVSLRKNKITTLDRNTWENIVDQLNKIHLEENPLQCDSEMEWLFEKGMSGKFIYGTCSGPRGKEGLSLKEFLRKGKE